MSIKTNSVVPAKAGTQDEYESRPKAGIHNFYRIPAFAGMTAERSKAQLSKLIATAVLAPVMFILSNAFAAPATSVAPLTTSASTALPATLAIPGFEMTYRAERNGWDIGESRITLQRDGDAWQFQSKSWPTGIASWFVHSTFTEASRFRIVGGRIQTLRYRYTDSGSPSHNESIVFDWTAGTATDREGDKKTTEVPIAPGMLDRLSAQIAISRRVAAGLPLTEPFRIVHGGEVDDYRLNREKTETITTPAGKFDTVLVVRRDPDSTRENRFWLAPKYAWVPVKMQQVEPGDATYTFTLTHLKWLTAEAKDKK